MSGGLRSGELATAAGVNVQTLRYYERRGLLDEPGRTPGGHRVYPAETVTVLRVIKVVQRLGFTLDDVAALLGTGRRRRGSRVEVGFPARAAVKLAEVEARIADLTAVRDILRAAVDAGCDDVLTCAEAQDCPLPFVERPAGTGAPRCSCCAPPGGRVALG